MDGANEFSFHLQHSSLFTSTHMFHTNMPPPSFFFMAMEFHIRTATAVPSVFRAGDQYIDVTAPKPVLVVCFKIRSKPHGWSGKRNGVWRTIFWFEERSSPVRNRGMHASLCPTKALPLPRIQGSGTTLKLFQYRRYVCRCVCLACR